MDKIQRLILINQYRILAALDEDESESCEEIIEALRSGYEIEINDLVDTTAYGWLPEDQCSFVMDVLDMYSALKRHRESKRISQADARKTSWYTFQGFDGNNETTHLSYARYLVVTQGKWTELKEEAGSFNTHMRSIPKYQRMLPLFDRAIEEVGSWDALTDEHVKAILEA